MGNYIKLQRELCYNPFYIMDGFTRHAGFIDKFVFFKDGKVVAENNKGWFGLGNNQIWCLSLFGVTKVKKVSSKVVARLDFNVLDTIYTQSHNNDFGEKRITAYIPADALSLTWVKQEKKEIIQGTILQTSDVYMIGGYGVLKNNKEEWQHITETFQSNFCNTETEFGEEVKKQKEIISRFANIGDYAIAEMLKNGYKIIKTRNKAMA